MRVGLRKNRIEAVNRIAGAFCKKSARTVETHLAATPVGIGGPAARLVKIAPDWQLRDELRA